MASVARIDLEGNQVGTITQGDRVKKGVTKG
jgi:hypothetical protein